MQYSDKTKKKVCGILLIAGIAAACLFVHRQSTNFKAFALDKAQDHLMTIAETGAKRIEDNFRHILDNLSALAEDEEIKRLTAHDVRSKVSSKENVGSREAEVIRHMKLMGLKMHGYYRLNAEGIIQNRIPFAADRIGMDFSGKPGVKYVIENHGPYVSDIFLAVKGHPCVSVCQPVFDDGQFTGIVRIMVLAETIQGMVDHMKVGQRGYAQVIDREGRLLAHPKTDHIGKGVMAVRRKAFPGLDWSELDRIAARMARGEAGAGTYRSVWWDEESPAFVTKLTAFHPVSVANNLWSLGVTMGYDEISGPIRAHSRSMLAKTLIPCSVQAVTGW